MTIYAYDGWKNDKLVATIDGVDRDWCLKFKRWTYTNYGTFPSLRAAKAAWRKIDGLGTRWKPH